MQKHLLGIKDMQSQDIEHILQTASEMKKILKQNVKKVPHLQNKSVVTLFYENSTRTRLSFENAAKFMSASVSSVSAAASSVQKGESLIDTGKTLCALMADIIIIRHPDSGSAHLLSKHVDAGVINAGDGINEHPTQALLDLLTLKERFGTIKGLNVSIYGDIRHSRVARSNCFALSKMGANVKVFAPYTLLPESVESLGCTVAKDMDDALIGANAVMGLRIQLERQKSGLFPSVNEYNRCYGLNSDNIKLMDKDAVIMHPGPINRGVEISSLAADGDNSLILEQVTNGVAVRMALLFLMTRGGK